MSGISYRDVHGIADELGVDVQTVRRWIQSGKLRAFKPGKEYRVREADLEEFLAAREVRPKAPASSQPSFNGLLEEERRAAWEDAVEQARRLRETGQTRMWKTLSEWRASKGRGEPYGTRRKYLDEMGKILQDAYGAYLALGNAYIEAALTQGGSEASVPSYLREETQAANDFYVEMFGLVRSAGLSVLTGDDATAAKQAAADEAAAEHAQSETRPHRVEEPAA